MQRVVSIAYGVFIVALVAAADSGRLGGLVDRLHAVPLGDKVCHLVLSMGLAYCAARLAPTPRMGTSPIPRVVPIVAIVAVIEELSQQFVPGRHFDLLDLAADGIGMALGTLLAARAQFAWN